MRPDGYLKASSQTCFLMITNLGHKFISAYSKWQKLYCRKQFLSCHQFTHRMSVFSQDVMSNQQRPK